MVVGGVMLLNLFLCLLILLIFKEVEIVYFVVIFVVLVCLVLRLIFVNMNFKINIVLYLINVILSGGGIVFIIYLI